MRGSPRNINHSVPADSVCSRTLMMNFKSSSSWSSAANAPCWASCRSHELRRLRFPHWERTTRSKGDCSTWAVTQQKVKSRRLRNLLMLKSLRLRPERGFKAFKCIYQSNVSKPDASTDSAVGVDASWSRAVSSVCRRSSHRAASWFQ